MSPLHRETLTVAVVAVGEPDKNGVAVVTTEPRAWGPCNVQQSTTTETRGGREVVVTRLHASGPLAEWITSDDAVTRPRDPGVTYHVDGRPAHFVGGVLDHTELVLVGWEGE